MRVDVMVYGKGKIGGRKEEGVARGSNILRILHAVVA